MNNKNVNIIKERISDSISIKQKILNSNNLIKQIGQITDIIQKCERNGGKILVCGNGGSASDSMHMVGELVGRFKKNRRAISAISLNSDIATLTAVANDFGYEEVFSRAIDAYMKKEDVLIGITTSGNSANVFRAMKKAKTKGYTTILLTGGNGGKTIDYSDYSIIVPSNITARIQECHILIIHIICELLEEAINE